MSLGFFRDFRRIFATLLTRDHVICMYKSLGKFEISCFCLCLKSYFRRLAQANTFDRKLEDVPAHKAALIRRKLSKESRERSSIIKHLRNNTLPRSSVLEEETSQMWTNEKMSMKERLEMAANVTDNVISKLAHMGSSSSSDGTYSTGRSSVGSQTDMDEVNSDDSFPQHNNAPTFKFDKDESDEEEVMLN